MEVWKDIKGYKGYYQVSNLGVIKSLSRNVKTKNGVRKTREKILKQSIRGEGYYYITLSKKHITTNKIIHRLVAQHFITNPEKKRTVNHKDGNKLNNNYKNLEWATHLENHQHARRNGFYNDYGEDSVKSKLKEKDVLDMRRLAKFFNYRELGIIFDISMGQAHRIVNRKRWKHI